jgi:hypothetical protein
LAIETDVTSKTQLSAYAALGVPELWQFAQGRLRISVLRQGVYVEVEHSPTFPGFAIAQELSHFIAMSLEQGSSAALRAFRQHMREHMLRESL